MDTTVQDSFNTFLKTGLNEQQRAAVLQPNNALLIIAGAGSGKTRVITSRIANLVINEHIEPRSIVALTFTNKAAGEMRERLVHTFKGQYHMPYIGTFHAYCLLLLRTMHGLVPSTHFSILDTDDQLDTIKKIMKKYAVAKHITANQISHQISHYKNRMFDPMTNNEQWFTPLLREIYMAYETEKINSHSLDFDDLIVHVLQGLKSNAQLRAQFQKNVRHILVDEYQDTSSVQHQLLLHMATDASKKFILDSLCAVGDEDQSIYSWRGATVANMLTFQSDFAPVTVIKVEQNYRSAQPILEAANTIIANNALRNPKNLWSTKKAKNRIVRITCQSGDQEAHIIAGLVKRMSQTTSLATIAVLYRTHFQSRPLEEALIHHTLPYRIIGGIRFYERKEIKDLLAYLRLIINPHDKISLLRIINTPSRGLGQKFEDQLLAAWTINPFHDFRQIIQWLISDPAHGMTESKKIALSQFLMLFADLEVNHTPSFVLNRILNTTQYISFLGGSYDMLEAQTKIENIQEFEQAILAFEKRYNDLLNDPTMPAPATTNLLEAFLHEVALLQDIDNNQEQSDSVQMMTLHAAKGLEFDTIIIAGLEEGLLPSSRSLNTHEALEEERRLMYVGTTRAKERLILCNAHSRLTFGQITEQAPSRFLGEIPQTLVHTLDLDEISVSTALARFEQWLSGKKLESTDAQSTHHTYTTARRVSKGSAMRTATTSNKKEPVSYTAGPATTPCPWAKRHVVKHPKFGVGIIEQVERGSDDFLVTVAFKAGKKKILAQFLEKI